MASAARTRGGGCMDEGGHIRARASALARGLTAQTRAGAAVATNDNDHDDHF